MSIHKVVQATNSRLAAAGKKVKEIRVEPAENGGYISSSNTDHYESNPKKSYHKNHKDLAAHIAKVMPC